MGYADLIGFGWSYFVQIINTIILFLILRKILFMPVRNFMLKRRDGIEKSLADASQKTIDALELRKQYEDKIFGASEEAREMIKQAMVKAETQSNEIIAEAHRKSSEILRRAEEDVDREKEQALRDLKDQIADLAIFAAEKVIEKELNTKEHHNLVNKVIEDARSAKWQN